MKVIGYLVSDGTTNTPSRMVLIEDRKQTEDAIHALNLQNMRDMVVVNPVQEPINPDPAVTTYFQVGETEVSFIVDLTHHLCYLNRIRDFLVGMGVLAQDGYMGWEPTLQMTVSQKQRWDTWFARLAG